MGKKALLVCLLFFAPPSSFADNSEDGDSEKVVNFVKDIASILFTGRSTEDMKDGVVPSVPLESNPPTTVNKDDDDEANPSPSPSGNSEDDDNNNEISESTPKPTPSPDPDVDGDKPDNGASNPDADDFMESPNSCVDDLLAKYPSPTTVSVVEICKSISMKCIHDTLQHLLVSGSTEKIAANDYACILISLLHKNTEFSTSINNLEEELKTAQSQLKTVKSSAPSPVPEPDLSSTLSSHIKAEGEFQLLTNQRITLIEDRLSLSHRSDEEDEGLVKRVEALETHTSLTEYELVEKMKKLESDTDKGSMEALVRKEVERTHHHFVQTLPSGHMMAPVSVGIQAPQLILLLQNMEFLKTTLSSNYTQLRKDVVEYRAQMQNRIDDCEEEVKKVLQTQFAALDRLSVELHTEVKMNINQSLQAEVGRAVEAEVRLETLVRDVSSRIQHARESFEALVSVESMRAKGVEGSMSSLLAKAVAQLGLVNSALEQVRQSLDDETRRATGAEAYLEKRVAEEVSRATVSEVGIMEEVKTRGEEGLSHIKAFGSKVEEVDLRVTLLSVDLGQVQLNSSMALESLWNETEGRFGRINKYFEDKLEAIRKQLPNDTLSVGKVPARGVGGVLNRFVGFLSGRRPVYKAAKMTTAQDTNAKAEKSLLESKDVEDADEDVSSRLRVEDVFTKEMEAEAAEAEVEQQVSSLPVNIHGTKSRVRKVYG